MATLSFNKDNRIDDFTFVLVRKDNYNIGVIQARDVNYNHNFNGPDELSLKVYKDLDPDFNKKWDRINDYNDLYVPQLGTNGYFEIEVSLNEDSEGVYKTITATSRCESELSHTKIYNYEVNSEDEITYDENWSKDNITLLYRDTSQKEAEIESLQEAISEATSSSERTRLQKLLKTAKNQLANIKHRSIMHRLLDKLPNYTIGHVDQTLIELTDWYQFSWDDESVYDIMVGDLADNYHVLFKFDSKNRIISLYDLYSVCMNNNCTYRTKMQTDRGITTRFRDDFHHSCPQCGSTNITGGYGKFTKIIVSKDNLMNSGQVSSNKDNLINCFKVKGGDELMDAAVINQNPNGSDYFYQFSDENLAEMPPNLVARIRAYDTEYNKWYQGEASSGKGIYTFTSNDVSNINAKIAFCKNNNFNHDITDNFINLKTTITGYQSLASQLYSLMDLYDFYSVSMVPDLDSSPESFEETFAKLTVANLSPVAVINPRDVVNESVQSAIVQSAKCIINTGLYDVTASGSYTAAASSSGTGTWRGTLTLVQIDKINTDEEGDYTRTTSTLTIIVNGNMNEYVTQRIEAMVNRKDTVLVDLNDILTRELEYIEQYNDVPENLYIEFVNKLEEYSLGVLTDVVRPCYVDILAIIEQNSTKINELYRSFYYDHLEAIDNEIKYNKSPAVKQIESVLNKVTKYRTSTQDALNFQTYLGTTLYNVFCDYRREDTFNNDNYIAEDLNNCIVMRRAGELIDAAQKELYKTSHLQYNVTGDLNDLLQLPEFASIKSDFEVGNWIKMSVDDTIYDLRLLSYSINFDNLQSISVEFSTVEKIWSGASDIKSVLQAAGSMAGSYSITQGKVKENSKSSKMVKDWVDTGLSATMTKFANDPVSQEIVYDSTGLYARGYDDTTGEYLPQQLKIVKNGLYLTDDGWNSIRTGVGAISYTDPENGQSVDTYGIIADTVVGKLILGEKLKIFNNNAGLKMDANGLTITGKNGTGVVKINPNDSSHIFQILNGSTRKFWADNNGNISMTGTITANYGSIGGWTISSNQLRSDVTIDNTKYSAVMQNMDGTNLARLAFFVGEYANGSSTMTSTSFSVNYNGSIHAEKGTIGGWTLSSDAIYKITSDNNYRIRLQAPSSATSSNYAIRVDQLVNGNWSNHFYVSYGGSVNFGGSGGITYNASTGKVTMGSDTTISWNRVSDKPTIPTDVNQLNDASGQKWSTTVGENFIKTTSVTAQNLVVNAVKINGKLTASQINTTGLIAENISATTLSGKTLTSATIYANAGTIGGFTISNSANQGTTANGGHYYTTSLYKHSSDDDYEYEVGMRGSASAGNHAFYIKQIAKGATWTEANISTPFYVTQAGSIGATKGKVGPLNITSNNAYVGTSDGNRLELSYSSRQGVTDYHVYIQNGSNTSFLASDRFQVGRYQLSGIDYDGSNIYTYSQLEVRNGLHSDFDIYCDGTIYCTTSNHVVLHAGNYKTYTGVKTATYISGDANVNSNTYHNFDFTSITIPSGYSLIGVPLCWIENGDDGAGMTNCTIGTISTINSGAGIRVRVRNDTSSNSYINVHIKVLFAKTT